MQFIPNSSQASQTRIQIPAIISRPFQCRIERAVECWSHFGKRQSGAILKEPFNRFISVYRPHVQPLISKPLWEASNKKNHSSLSGFLFPWNFVFFSSQHEQKFPGKPGNIQTEISTMQWNPGRHVGARRFYLSALHLLVGMYLYWTPRRAASSRPYVSGFNVC